MQKNTAHLSLIRDMTTRFNCPLRTPKEKTMASGPNPTGLKGPEEGSNDNLLSRSFSFFFLFQGASQHRARLFATTPKHLPLHAMLEIQANKWRWFKNICPKQLSDFTEVKDKDFVNGHCHSEKSTSCFKMRPK